jgi:hypothetical protein
MFHPYKHAWSALRMCRPLYLYNSRHPKNELSSYSGFFSYCEVNCGRKSERQSSLTSGISSEEEDLECETSSVAEDFFFVTIFISLVVSLVVFRHFYLFSFNEDNLFVKKEYHLLEDDIRLTAMQ